MRFLSFLPLGVLALATAGNASHRLSGRLGSTSPGGLERRSSMSGTLSQLSDSQNLVYSTNVTLNGASFSVLIDTGSSDFWVSSLVPSAVSQNYQAEVSYASGSASGDVMSATLDFAGFTIQSQFFIEAPGADAASGADGLIGLGPSSGSSVRELGESSAANPPLDRIFTSNSSLSPQIAILLQRSDDPDEPYPGDLAIGEVLTDYQDILNQPQLPVTIASLEGNQHWQTLLDVNGIIGPNGQPIQIETQVTGAQTKNATVIFDTGFTLPQVPSNVAQAMYSEIPGAILTNLSDFGDIWVLPCDQQVNATFLFGGVEFPIHPLDLNFDGFDLETDGLAYCVGAFQPYSFDIEEDGKVLFDIVLGMAFLRNAYMLINFGNLVDAATPSTDTAYIQLLPVTNATQAAQDFASVRSTVGGATADQMAQLFSPSSTSSSTSSSISPWLIAAIAVAGLVLVLLLAVIVRCCRRRRVKSATTSAAVWPVNAPSYRPLHDPSPQAAYDMHMVPGTAWSANPPSYQQVYEPSPQAASSMRMGSGALPGYTPAYVPGYETAWDARY